MAMVSFANKKFSPVTMWRHTGSDESVTDKHMKTIEMAPPSWVDLSRGRGLLRALNNWAMRRLQQPCQELANLLVIR